MFDFNESKCRNVLVRYCAHIPRNYQYSDGIRLVFLVLRDHLGDEHLGAAGGVLYEMIEVDCQYSDDPGAAFQRWRHSHMNRHANLELPHIPHLTTVSTAIAPTAALVRWRAEHPQRYHTRLSDHCGDTIQRQASCLRHRRSWTIDYTTFVTSKKKGTQPLREIKAHEFHQIHWDHTTTHRGRLIAEEPFYFSEPSTPSFQQVLTLDPQSLDDNTSRSSMNSKGELWRSIATVFRRLPKFSKRKANETFERLPESQSSMSSCRFYEPPLSPEVPECEIPNASFARKFGILTASHALPRDIKELPVAENKAVRNVDKLLHQDLTASLGFLGPFTPQLWFDGGLDYHKTTQK